MKSQASAKEEKPKESNNIISHGEFSLKRRSLWLIIFTGIIFFITAHYYSDYVVSLSPQGEALFTQGEVKRVTLENGMVVLVKEEHGLPLVSLFLCLRTGSGREGRFSGGGISHFIEHMVFKGTKERKVGDIFREIEFYGGRINAVTSYDYTGYKIIVPSDFTYPSLQILADMAMNATFDEEELKKEREVVLKEIRLNYDSPQRYASRVLWQTAYSVHPYRYPILGEEDFFKDLTREDLLGFYQANYVPNNMILTVVGDVRAEDILTFVRELFKDFPQQTIADFKYQPEPGQDKLRRHEEEFTSGLTYLLFGFHSVTVTDKDCFALDVLATILGEGETSRLYKLICNKKRLAFSVKAINYTPREPGLFIIFCLLEEQKRRRLDALIFDQIELIKKKKVSQDELESAKNKIISDVLFHNQTIEAQAQDLALNEAITGDFRFTERYIRKIKEVNSQDILRVARKYLHKNNSNIVALIPRAETAKSDLDRDRETDKPLRIGIENLTRDRDEEKDFAVQRHVLDNGLTLLARERREMPLVSIKAVFKGGLRTENQDTNGLCNLVAQMLDKGTRSKNAAEIASLIESKGARLSYFSGNNSFGLSLELLSKDFDQMLKLFADLIINSTFPVKELKKQKERSLAELKTIKDNVFESGTKLLKRTLFQKHPYRFLTIGNEKSLKKLKRRDLINFYRNFCVGKNMVLAVFGDIDTQETALKVERFFAKLKSGDIPRIAPEEEPQIKVMRTASQTLPKKQSLLFLGFQGTTVLNQDRYVLELICQILSQGSGRLFTQIREKTGAAYTLGAYSVLGLDPGYLIIYVATTSEHLGTVKSEILHQLCLLKQEPITEEELRQAKNALLGAKLISRQTNSACAFESALDELYGLGFNHYLEYTQQIERIEAKDIKRCANQYFDLNNYALVVLGSEG